MLEYTNLFNHLSQYAAIHVDTDPKKRSCYLWGLNDKMEDKLSTSSYVDFNELVSLAIHAEERNRIYKEGKKRRNPSTIPSGPGPQLTRIIYRILARPYQQPT